MTTKTLIATPKPEEVECQCGAVAAIERDRWTSWVQLAQHRQPRTGLLCSPTRLQRKNSSPDRIKEDRG